MVNVARMKSQLPDEIRKAFKRKPYDIYAIQKYLRKKTRTQIGIGYAGYDVYTIYSGRSDRPQNFIRGRALIQLVLDKTKKRRRK